MTGSGPGGQPLLCSWTENYAGREMYSPGSFVGQSAD